MKVLFNKFKASTRFDQEAKSGRNSRHEELQQFEKSLLEMDRELSAFRSNAALPKNLHSSIMTAIRASDTEVEASATGLFWLKLAGASLAFAAVVGLLFWLTDQSSLKDKASLPPPVIAASLASGFDEGHELTQVAPKAALEPLSGEMELLERDFRNAVTFLVASMP